MHEAQLKHAPPHGHHLVFGVQGLGVGLGFRVQGSGFSLVFEVQGLGVCLGLSV